MLQGLFAAEQNGGQKLQSHWRNGSWAEKVLVPIENVHPIPESLLERYPTTKLSEINTTLVPYGGLLAGGLEAGQTVMIQPATGHFGAAAVAVAVAMGASTVYAVGRNGTVLDELVARFGPRIKPVVIQGTEEDKEVYASLEVDMTLNLYPPGTPADNVGYGLGALKSGGTLVLMGGVANPVTFPYGEIMQRCLTVRGQFMYPPSAVKKMVGMVESRVLDLNVFEQRVFNFEDVVDAVEFSASKENRGWLFSVVLEMK
jgi:alcohol dehydrogenase